jgi:Fur family iron response transcriptional regulator
MQAKQLKAIPESLSERLMEHGVKPTPQRLEIARLMLSQPCHMSAEQVMASLRDAGSCVSKATVYNTLHLFSQQGLLREIALDPARLFYDSTTRAHHHIYNEDTGELLDVETSDLEISRFPPLPKGTDAQSPDVVIRVRNRRG